MSYFHSMLMEMRCQVHSELAVIEEQDGCLEASLTHLQKAMKLDNGTQQERLTSALRLLQLRGDLYQTPTQTEDQATMLLQQVFSSTVMHYKILPFFKAGKIKITTHT